MPRKKSSCGCFAFLAIFSSKKKTQAFPLQVPLPIASNNENISSHSSSQRESEGSKNIRKIDVLSKLTTEDVKVMDFIQETAQKMDFPYSCSICLRNFNKVLQTSCCKNYICLFCIEDYNKRFQTTPNLKIRCHYCAEESFQFIDVDPTEKIKRYTDSVSSFYSNFKTLKGLKPHNTGSKLEVEDGFRSPNIDDLLNPDPVNFYHTAEKPLENLQTNQENPVFFYSDGFKRAQVLPKPLSENLYIYNEDQANYQSLSKFAQKKRGNSISDDKIINNTDGNNRYHGDPRFDPKNISESAEFRHDESLNDREIGELNEQILEENNRNEENQQEFENNNAIEMGTNQENLGYFNSLNAHGTGRGKWIGMKVDFGDTV